MLQLVLKIESKKITRVARFYRLRAFTNSIISAGSELRNVYQKYHSKKKKNALTSLAANFCDLEFVAISNKWTDLLFRTNYRTWRSAYNVKAY